MQEKGGLGRPVPLPLLEGLLDEETSLSHKILALRMIFS